MRRFDVLRTVAVQHLFPLDAAHLIDNPLEHAPYGVRRQGAAIV
jgi:hypothetical protein